MLSFTGKRQRFPKTKPRYQFGPEVLGGLPYNIWRTTSPEDTLRFHALRLHEVGMNKANPAKLTFQWTD